MQAMQAMEAGMTSVLSRMLAVAAILALLPGCTGFPRAVPALQTGYTAVQVIRTTPGPFVSRLYVSADRERQDASLGGDTVTTIVRRDLGVAWLLIPARQQYQVVPLAGGVPATVQAGCGKLKQRPVGSDTLDGVAVRKVACVDGDGREAALAWVSADGIVLKAEVPADPAAGKPGAVIVLEQVQPGEQMPSLFELPAGYTRVEATVAVEIGPVELP